MKRISAKGPARVARITLRRKPNAWLLLIDTGNLKRPDVSISMNESSRARELDVWLFEDGDTSRDKFTRVLIRGDTKEEKAYLRTAAALIYSGRYGPTIYLHRPSTPVTA